MFRKQKVTEVPETTKENYDFHYQLSYGEAYESFLNISEKGKKKPRQIATVLVCAAAVGLLIGYALDRTRVHFLFTALMAVVVLAFLIYVPALTAKRGASKVAKINGTYQIRISRTGQFTLPRSEAAPLAGDKNSRALETENMFVIRADNASTICLPKRIMKDYEKEDIRRILQTYVPFEDRR